MKKPAKQKARGEKKTNTRRWKKLERKLLDLWPSGYLLDKKTVGLQHPNADDGPSLMLDLSCYAKPPKDRLAQLELLTEVLERRDMAVAKQQVERLLREHDLQSLVKHAEAAVALWHRYQYTTRLFRELWDASRQEERSAAIMLTAHRSFESDSFESAQIALGLPVIED